MNENDTEMRLRIDSTDLKRLAGLLDGRLSLQCPRCQNWRCLSIRLRELRFGSSPDLSAIDARQPSRPRLMLYCSLCKRMIGFVQGDDWVDADVEKNDTRPEDATRWDRLEIDAADDTYHR